MDPNWTEPLTKLDGLVLLIMAAGVAILPRVGRLVAVWILIAALVYVQSAAPG